MTENARSPATTPESDVPEYYLGLMSGTSADGIDVALVDLSGKRPQLLFAHTYPWSDPLREEILAIIAQHTSVSLADLGSLDAALGEAFAEAAVAAISSANLRPEQVVAIGSHGQTLFHAPLESRPFSLQAGDPNRIAEATGITTVADFRRRDIAAGGQGAPLVPAFHHALFHDPDRTTAIINIGGMANITLLPKAYGTITGFDTGPGNVLLDVWHQKHRQGHYDANGAWAAGGVVCAELLEQLLAHPFFSQPPPKSTGRELFCLAWLEEQLRTNKSQPAAADVQRTLVELTAQTISDAVRRYGADTEEVLVCGGGAHNALLMQRLTEIFSPLKVQTTETRGLHPDWVEATAFAWLAQQTLAGQPGNIPGATGARHAVVLGAVYCGRI